MRRIILCIGLSFGLSPLLAQVGNYYQEEVLQQTYQPLTNGTKISPLPGFNGAYLLEIDAPWTFFGGQTDNDSLIIGENGFLVTTGPQYSMAFDPFIVELTEKGTANSGLFVEYDSLSNPRRLSVEWRNMTLEGNPPGDVANFKINFYSNEVVEFHYGLCVASDTAAFHGETGPSVVLALLSRDFNLAYDIRFASGDPQNPVFSSQPANPYLNGVPTNGTMYRFEPYNIGLPQQAHIDKLSLFPNPATDVVRINDARPLKAELYSAAGHRLGLLSFQGGKADVSALTPGVYFLKVIGTNTGHAQVKRLIIQ